MPRTTILPLAQQYSLAYLLSETALIAIALACGRLAFFPHAMWAEGQATLFCLAVTAGCGALGGLCLRMTVGLVAGGVFSVASIPLMWLAIHA